ncbi:hypothetical protein INT45_009239 [Circinella minor]|uniref:Uncharacterized protein n=1 Tax=Circinella minor TaxID=1195481 RepID=A0A8H7SHE4_9FUNG|nr:hypothetical protein INT45_009239 [Circinella minor]
MTRHITSLPSMYEPPSSSNPKSVIGLHKNNNISPKRAELSGSKTLAACRTTSGINPIMWLSMTRKERSCCIRWEICWLSGAELDDHQYPTSTQQQYQNENPSQATINMN